MKERMISCKHCGERIRPDEEKCPYCNKKLEVDYARLYPAYENKKYYMFMPNSIGGIAFFLFGMLILLASCISPIAVIIANLQMKPGVWLVLVPIGLFLLSLSAFIAYAITEAFTSYMIWDGKDTVTIKKLRGSKNFSISSVSHVARCISTNAKGHTIVKHVVIANRDTPVYAFYRDREVLEFFLHFGIKEVPDSDMKYSWYKEKRFGK